MGVGGSWRFCIFSILSPGPSQNHQKQMVFNFLSPGPSQNNQKPIVFFNWDTSGTRQPDPLVAIMVGKFEKSSWRGEHDAEQAVNQDAGCFRTGGVFVMPACAFVFHREETSSEALCSCSGA